MAEVGKLILVRHAQPAADPCVAPSQWPLSEAGRAGCAPLARALQPYLPAALFASREAKAAETAMLTARALGTRFAPWAGLHEHVRTRVGWLSQAEFRAGVEALFTRPGEAVFGDESADAAHARFAAAVTALLAHAPPGNVVAFTHGTVITLLVTRANADLAPLDFWHRLGRPALVVVERATLRLDRVLERVGDDGLEVG